MSNFQEEKHLKQKIAVDSGTGGKLFPQDNWPIDTCVWLGEFVLAGITRIII